MKKVLEEYVTSNKENNTEILSLQRSLDILQDVTAKIKQLFEWLAKNN